MEKALNTKLFERRNTGYLPTHSGEKLLRTAEQVESAILSGESELADRDLSLSGIVRIGAPDGFGSIFLAPRLAEFCRIHPQVDVQLIATSRLFSLSKREADIAIALDMPTHGRVVAKKLTDYRLGPVSYTHLDVYKRQVEDVARFKIYGDAQKKLVEDQVNVFLFMLPKATVSKAGLNGMWENWPLPVTPATDLSWK